MLVVNESSNYLPTLRSSRLRQPPTLLFMLCTLHYPVLKIWCDPSHGIKIYCINFDIEIFSGLIFSPEISKPREISRRWFSNVKIHISVPGQWFPSCYSHSLPTFSIRLHFAWWKFETVRSSTEDCAGVSWYDVINSLHLEQDWLLYQWGLQDLPWSCLWYTQAGECLERWRISDDPDKVPGTPGGSTPRPAGQGGVRKNPVRHKQFFNEKYFSGSLPKS